jgi:hypothetical protein
MRRRTQQGQSTVEAVTAAIVIVPIALCLFDLLVVIIGNSMNDTACKNACRAAANQPDVGSGFNAANMSLTAVHSPLLNNISLLTLTMQNGVVKAKTQASIHLPVPFPGYSDLVFQAEDVEPQVGATPNQ